MLFMYYNRIFVSRKIYIKFWKFEDYDKNSIYFELFLK